MRKAYPYLYLMQFIGSILVVIIHCGRLTNQPHLHFLLKSMICRIAVPFFIVNNAFFYRQKTVTQQSFWRIKNYQRYLGWSILYLPLGIIFLQEKIMLPIYLYPVGMIYGFLYSGTFYHLWYFPALFLALFLVEKSLERLSLPMTFLLFLILFIIGSIETYSAFFPSDFWQAYISSYFSIFLTTRNGLLYAPMFVLIGFILCDYLPLLIERRTATRYLLTASCLLFLIEAMIVFQNQGKDKNFFLSLIPLSFSFFLYLLQQEAPCSFSQLKDYSQLLFFCHLIPIQLFELIYREGQVITANNGRIKLVLSLSFSFALTFLLKLLARKKIAAKILKS